MVFARVFPYGRGLLVLHVDTCEINDVLFEYADNVNMTCLLIKRSRHACAPKRAIA